LPGKYGAGQNMLEFTCAMVDFCKKSQKYF